MKTHLRRDVETEGLHLPDDASRKLTRRSDVRTQVVDGETVVLDERAGQIHQLNRTASFIWQTCDGSKSVKDITRLLSQEFDVSEAAAAADVADMIERLRELGLLCE